MKLTYPITQEEFESQFETDEQCIRYLESIRWPNGFECPRCHSTEHFILKRYKYECRKCHYQTTVLSGTIFQDTKKPLSLWFKAIWMIVTRKSGTSAMYVKQIMGFGSYETAWRWLHKIRRAMVRSGREKLVGKVEVDETYIGATIAGSKRGRGAQNKDIVAVAIEVNDQSIRETSLGRTRLAIIPAVNGNILREFIMENIEQGSTVITDGLNCYNRVKEWGYDHEVINQKKEKEEGKSADDLLPHVHLLISLLLRWILGTLQGSYSSSHMQYFLDEFTFRFNRRKSKYRGLLFRRLLENAVITPPSVHDDIVHNR